VNPPSSEPAARKKNNCLPSLKQGSNTTWSDFNDKPHNILYERRKPNVNGVLTAQNQAFLLTSPMINSISAPCGLNEKNHVISTIQTIYAKKIREEVTLKPPVGDGSLFIGRLV
jgi:hypothetical protein